MTKRNIDNLDIISILILNSVSILYNIKILWPSYENKPSIESQKNNLSKE
jgi:hypothetical protein